MPRLVKAGPWPPARFVVDPGTDPAIKAVLVAVFDGETHETMWTSSVLGMSAERAELHKPRSASVRDRGSAEADRAIREFDEGLQFLAHARGITIREITYGVSPPGLSEAITAKPLISGRTYLLGVIGTERVELSFRAP